MPVSQSNTAVSRAVAAAALDARTRSGCRPVGGDEAAAFELALAAQEERGEAARLADRRDAIAVVRVLEAVDRFADQEALRAENTL